MARKVGHVIHDILEAIARVEEITHDKSLADFEASWQLRWMVQRAIEIISEASRAIPDDLTSTRPEILGARYVASAMSFGTTMKDCRTASFGMSSSTSCRVSRQPRRPLPNSRATKPARPGMRAPLGNHEGHHPCRDMIEAGAGSCPP
jgi:hypothetical protein